MQVNNRSNAATTKPAGPKQQEEEADPIEAVTEKIEIADQLSIAKEAGVFVARVGSQVPKLEKLGKVAALVEGEAAVVASMADAGTKTGKFLGAVGKGFAALAKVAPIISVVTAGSDIVELSREKDPEAKQALMGHVSLCVGTAAMALGALAFPPAALGLGLAAGAVSLFQLVDTYANGEKLQGALGKGISKVFGLFKGEEPAAHASAK